MKYTMSFLCSLSITLSGSFLCSSSVWAGSFTKNDLIVIQPEEYTRPLRNPHKGFTNRGRWEDNEWATLMHSYIQWNQIENTFSDGIEKIKNWCENEWAGVEDRNVKVIPRVYLHWDGDLTYWPEDMETFDYSSDQFKERVRRLIDRLGECWDTDPRVAHIEMGIIGKWGEHHSPSPSNEVEQLLGEEFRRAFKNKKVLVRHPWEFKEFEFGIYWDSWAHFDQMNSHGQGIADIGDRWKSEIIGGETAYNWGGWEIQPGDDPTDTMVDPIHRNHLIYTIRWLHCTQLRWVADYDQSNAKAREGAEEVQKVFGYRYVVDEVTFPKRIEKGIEFPVSFSVRNTGSAPFYYDWPVELSLLDESGKVIWNADFDGADIREWLPGENWNTNRNEYEIKAESYLVSGSFMLDEDVKAGTYRLALAVLDPAGGLPGLRLAIKNYIKGGRHPIGYIGVGSDVDNTSIDPSTFDDPYADDSLHYIFDPALVGFSARKTGEKPPRTSILAQNYPNPFNPSTRISFSLPVQEKVTLEVFDVLGKKIATLVDNQLRAPGDHVVTFDGSERPTGIYLYRLQAGQKEYLHKMMLLK